MSTNQEMFNERVEIILRTDAKLDSSERVQCEVEIREILNVEGVEVCDLSFREGSTIITISILVGSGLAFCFAHFFSGALKEFGKRSAELLLTKLSRKLHNYQKTRDLRHKVKGAQ